MKKLILLLSIASSLIISSCSMHVFYITSNTKSDTDTAFIFENDTLQIAYNLWERGGRMHFSIYNKLNVPLFIDWKNSSFILNDIGIAYWSDETITKSSGGGVSYKGISSYGSSGSMVHIDRVTMIPPHSKILKNYKGHLCKFDFPTNEDATKRFRNYITYSTSEDTQNESFANNEFSVVEIKKIKAGKLIKYKSDKRFYTYK